MPYKHQEDKIKYLERTRDIRNAKRKEYYKKNKEKLLNIEKRYRENNLEKILAKGKIFRDSHKQLLIDRAKQKRIELKQLVIETYGGKCEVCGISKSLMETQRCWDKSCPKKEEHANQG